jgi:hypothetical protein
MSNYWENVMSLIHAQALDKKLWRTNLIFRQLRSTYSSRITSGLLHQWLRKKHAAAHDSGSRTARRKRAALRFKKRELRHARSIAFLEQGMTLFEAVLEASDKWMVTERELHAIAEAIESGGATEQLIRRQADLQGSLTRPAAG